jgi:hypothetical protein
LTATAADGTQFVLTIPPDATALPLQITLTPVSDSGPFPFRGGHAAVKIEPEGAFLWQPAALKILPPSPPDLKSLIYFRDGGPDGRFTLYPGVLGATRSQGSVGASPDTDPAGSIPLPCSLRCPSSRSLQADARRRSRYRDLSRRGLWPLGRGLDQCRVPHPGLAGRRL